MMKNVSRMIFFTIVFMLIQSLSVHAASGTELMNCFSVRITIVENELEHEWEFDNPNRYEYEKGNTVIKGEKAKAEVTSLLKELQLSEKKTKEDYAIILKHKFPELEQFEIHWMNRDSERFVWKMSI